MGHGIFHKRGWAALILGAWFFAFFCVPLGLTQTAPGPTAAETYAAAHKAAEGQWVADQTEPTPLDWATFMQSIGSWGTLNRLGMAAVATQGLLLLMRTKLGDLTGKAKLAIVSVCSVSIGVIALRTGGLDWGQAFMHSTTLAALQVFGHQLAQTYLPKTGGPA
jgi:hypothetical protein